MLSKIRERRALQWQVSQHRFGEMDENHCSDGATVNGIHHAFRDRFRAEVAPVDLIDQVEVRMVNEVRGDKLWRWL